MRKPESTQILNLWWYRITLSISNCRRVCPEYQTQVEKTVTNVQQNRWRGTNFRVWEKTKQLVFYARSIASLYAVLLLPIMVTAGKTVAKYAASVRLTPLILSLQIAFKLYWNKTDLTLATEFHAMVEKSSKVCFAASFFSDHFHQNYKLLGTGYNKGF